MNTAIALLNNYGNIPNLPEEYSQRFNNIVKKCLELQPEDRPTAADLVQWSSFYLDEGYWPDCHPIPPSPSPTLMWKKIIKPIAIIGISALIILGTCMFLLPYFFNPEKKLNAALEAYDLQTAAQIYAKMEPKLKAKYPDLTYLSDVVPARVAQGDGFHFMIVKSLSTQKIGLMDNSGALLIPVQYDHILKIHHPAVITVKDGNVCSHYDLTVSPVDKIDLGVCKVFKTKQEFRNQFYKNE
jgi:serine/threonine protein kinase